MRRTGQVPAAVDGDAQQPSLEVLLTLKAAVVAQELFKDPAGAGYPRERAESQGQSRKKLAEISKMTHKDLTQILLDTDSKILKAIAGTDSFMEVLEHGGDGAKDVLEYLKQFR